MTESSLAVTITIQLGLLFQDLLKARNCAWQFEMAFKEVFLVDPFRCVSYLEGFWRNSGAHRRRHGVQSNFLISHVLPASVDWTSSQLRSPIRLWSSGRLIKTPWAQGVGKLIYPLKMLQSTFVNTC